jgi:hypothetical protein
MQEKPKEPGEGDMGGGTKYPQGETGKQGGTGQGDIGKKGGTGDVGREGDKTGTEKR